MENQQENSMRTETAARCIFLCHDNRDSVRYVAFQVCQAGTDAVRGGDCVDG